MPLAQFGFLLPEDVRSDYGFQASFAVPNPAVGTEFIRLVPGAFFEVVTAVRYGIANSAAGANRTGRISILDGDDVEIFNMKALQYLTAGQTGAFKWSLALSSAYAPDNLSQHMPLFPFVMPSGWKMRLGASNLQAGDQLQNIGFVIQQYVTGIEPERFAQIQPLDLRDLGILVGAPLSVPSVTSPGTSSAPPSAPPPSAPAPTAPVVGQQFFEPAPEPFSVPGPAHAE